MLTLYHVSREGRPAQRKHHIPPISLTPPPIDLTWPAAGASAGRQRVLQACLLSVPTVTFRPPLGTGLLQPCYSPYLLDACAWRRTRHVGDRQGRGRDSAGEVKGGVTKQLSVCVPSLHSCLPWAAVAGGTVLWRRPAALIGFATACPVGGRGAANRESSCWVCYGLCSGWGGSCTKNWKTHEIIAERVVTQGRYLSGVL